MIKRNFSYIFCIRENISPCLLCRKTLLVVYTTTEQKGGREGADQLILTIKINTNDSVLCVFVWTELYSVDNICSKMWSHEWSAGNWPIFQNCPSEVHQVIGALWECGIQGIHCPSSAVHCPSNALHCPSSALHCPSSALIARVLRFIARALRYIARVVRYIVRVMRYIARVVRFIARVVRYIARVVRYIARVVRYIARAVRPTFLV